MYIYAKRKKERGRLKSVPKPNFDSVWGQRLDECWKEGHYCCYFNNARIALVSWYPPSHLFQPWRFSKIFFHILLLFPLQFVCFIFLFFGILVCLPWVFLSEWLKRIGCSCNLVASQRDGPTHLFMASLKFLCILNCRQLAPMEFAKLA